MAASCLEWKHSRILQWNFILIFHDLVHEQCCIFKQKLKTSLSAASSMSKETYNKGNHLISTLLELLNSLCFVTTQLIMSQTICIFLSAKPHWRNCSFVKIGLYWNWSRRNCKKIRIYFAFKITSQFAVEMACPYSYFTTIFSCILHFSS